MDTRIRGIFNILATPFDDAKALDIPNLKRLVNFQLDKGAHGLTILGVLGEAPKLSVEERHRVMETVIETVNGQVPVIVGASHNDVKTCVDLSKAAAQAGADGLMIAPPRMDNPTDDAILAFYGEVTSNVSLPIVVQDFPPINNVIMSPDMLARLAETLPTARYLKLEDPPLMQKISAIRQRTDKFNIFGGLGGMFMLEELNRGSSGTMTGFAFTEILLAIYEAYRAGHMADAERIFDRYLPLIRFENQHKINLTIRKALLHRRGAIANPTPRDPYEPIDGETEATFDWLFRRVGIADPTQKLTFYQVSE